MNSGDRQHQRASINSLPTQLLFFLLEGTATWWWTSTIILLVVVCCVYYCKQTTCSTTTTPQCSLIESSSIAGSICRTTGRQLRRVPHMLNELMFSHRKVDHWIGLRLPREGITFFLRWIHLTLTMLVLALFCRDDDVWWWSSEAIYRGILGSRLSIDLFIESPTTTASSSRSIFKRQQQCKEKSTLINIQLW